MRLILMPFVLLAGIGLVLSLIVHGYALLGIPCPFGEVAWALHVGIFVVWFPAVIASQKLTKDFKQKDFWRATLRGCPKWMRHLTYFFFAYAIVNFILFMVIDIGGGLEKSTENGTPPNIFRGFSGHWMAFYSAAMAMLYSAIHAKEHDETRRCLNGHPVSPSAKFCEECGAVVTESDK